MEDIIITVHAPSERAFWKESRSGSVGVVISIQDGDLDPLLAEGVDPDSDHNSRTWIWAATEAVKRTHPQPGQDLVLRGMHPLIRDAFEGRGSVYGAWKTELNALKREMTKRFRHWRYVSTEGMRGTKDFQRALELGRKGAHRRRIDWPPHAFVTETAYVDKATESVVEELFA